MHTCYIESPNNSIRALNKALSCLPLCEEGNTTAAVLTPFAEEKAKDIFDRRNDYLTLRYSENEWLVMHKNGMNQLKSNKDISKVSFENCFCKPAFTNVYKVSLSLLNKRMKCSCCTVTRIGMPCQHIYAVVNQREPEMFHVRWYSIYNSLKIDLTKDMKEILDTLHSEHYYKFLDSIFVGSVLNELIPYSGLIIKMPIDTVAYMVNTYVSHLHGTAVKRNDPMKTEHIRHSLLTEHPEFQELYSSINHGMSIEVQESLDKNLHLVDSQESNPDHIVSRKKERTNASTIDLDKIRYYKLMERFRQLAKIGEGRPEIFDEILSKIDELHVEFTHKAIDSSYILTNEQANTQQRKLVSSNASTDCTPNRGRYKGFHEKK